MNFWRLQKPQSKNSAKEVPLATTQCLSRFLWLNQVCRKGLSDSWTLCCAAVIPHERIVFGFTASFLVRDSNVLRWDIYDIYDTYMTYVFVVFMWSCEILGLVALNLFGLHSFCWPQYFSCKPFFYWRWQRVSLLWAGGSGGNLFTSHLNKKNEI